MSDFEKIYKDMTSLLEILVNIDSGSMDKEGVDKVGNIMVEELKKLNFYPKYSSNEIYGNNIILKQQEVSSPKVLIIAHMDTVFKNGTSKKRPFTIKHEKAYGPGVADMKGSLVTLLYALKLIYKDNEKSLRNILIILNSDEEIGSVTSKPLIEKHSKISDFAIIMEPARANGSIVTSRRGGGVYHIEIEGIKAHSGVAPEEGASAVQELAHKIISINKLNDYKNGISINIGIIEGGEATNVIPDKAFGKVEVRVKTQNQARYVDKKISEICSIPNVKNTRIKLSGGLNRPPMELNENNKKLLDIIKVAGEEIGVNITHTHTGGGSDASFTSKEGVPTIDGMGPIGGKLHNEDEYIELTSLSERTLLLSKTISKLVSLK